MKNRFFTTAFFLILVVAGVSAQHKVGLGAGLGFARLTGDLGENGGFGFTYGLEGKYFLSPKLAVGAEYNSNILVYKEESNLIDIGAYGNSQYLAKGEYFLMNKKFRPYVGLGLGFSQIETPEITITGDDGVSSVAVPAEKKGNFGVVPRLGFMIGGLGVEFDYNFSGKTPKSEYQNVGSANKSFTYYNIKLKYVYDFEF